jgi:hypothetical protein
VALETKHWCFVAWNLNKSTYYCSKATIDRQICKIFNLTELQLPPIVQSLSLKEPEDGLIFTGISPKSSGWTKGAQNEIRPAEVSAMVEG